MNVDEIIAHMRSLGEPRNVEGMARYGIESRGALGVPLPVLRKLAKRIDRDHELAGELWTADIYEARLLATLIDDPRAVDAAQMERWVSDFDSWALCDGACMNLFRWTDFAYDKARDWCDRTGEYEKRAGFAMMASLASGDKAAPDDEFEQFLPIIAARADDDRKYVKKAVSWALRQIGKRNVHLHGRAVACAEQLAGSASRADRWVGKDAMRELRSNKVLERLGVVG